MEHNREQRNKPIHNVQMIFEKVLRSLNGEIIVFSTNLLGKNEYPHTKE